MNKRTLACLLFAVWSLTTVGLVYGQEATSFRLEGTVKQVTGEAVAGLTVTAINQRVPTGWLTASEFTTRDYDPNNPRSKPEDKGTYTIVYLDPFSGNVTRVGDTIKITVTEGGKAVGGATHVVTVADIEANSVTVNIILGGLQIDLNPKTLAADGSSTSSITVKIYSEDGTPVTDDTPTITSAKGATISEVINKGDGSYTATYTAPALVDITAAVEDQLTVMSMTLDESATASLTLNVPKTVVMVAVSPSAEFSSVSSDTGAVSVTVMRAGMPITGETISFELTRGDGGTDVGSITDAGVDGVYEFTYTPSKMVGEIKLVATAEKAGVSSGPVMITINAGPPAKITLMADLMTLSSGQTARITVMVMDASGNGVGGLKDDLDVSTSGSGTVGMVEKGSKFGEYTVTYTAPVVDEAGMEGITVSIPNSDVSGTIMLDLTPVPPREVSILAITGTVFKKNSEVPASGVTVSVMVNGFSDVSMTGDNGGYTATRVNPGGVAARTGDRVVIVVTDSTGKRGGVDFALTNEQLGEGDSTTITQNVETDIKLSTTTLVVLGKVLLEDGESPVPAGMAVTIANLTRGRTQTGVTEEDGCYQVTFVGLGTDVAETDDELMVTVEDASGTTYKLPMPYTLTGDDVNAGQAAIDIITDFTADPTTVMVVEGTVTKPDGSRAEAGLVVTITIGEREPGETTTNADGAYSYRHTFVKPRSSAAMPGDVVKVEVLREATGEEGFEMTEPLLSKDILNRYVQVDVQFPAAIIEITTPMPVSVSLDSDGNGMVDIMATITDAAGTIVIGLSITAEVDGMGSVTSPAMDNGDGTYTVTYTAAPKMIGENLATVTLMAADEPGTPMDSVMVSVVDKEPPDVMAVAMPDVAVLGQTVTFDSSGTTDNVDDDLSYSWDLGDGTTSTEAKVEHVYAEEGIYTAQLTVTDASGNAATSEMIQIIVDETMPTVEATATPSVVGLNQPVTFDSSGTTDNVSDAADLIYSWDFGDEMTSTEAKVEHVYAEEGIYTAQLTVTDAAGNAATSEMIQIIVDETMPTVQATATPSVVGLNQPVTFDGSGTTDDVDDDLSYSWDLGDGTTSTEAKVEHAYDKPGIYTAQLTVTDVAGNEGTSELIQIVVGGLVVRGSVVEADGMDLMSPVTVKIMHTGSGEYVMAEVTGADYEAIFQKEQSDKFSAGDSLMVEAYSMGDSAMLLGSALHTLTQDELDSGIANITMDVRIDRTSTYTITGLVLGDGLQPIEGAIVMAETAGGLKVSDMTDAIGSYSLFFDDFMMNPTVGEEITIMAEVPDGIPLRTSVVAFMQDGSRISRADLRSVRLGGLGLNTPHYHRFVHGVIQHIIGGTTVGKALEDASPEQQRHITNEIIRLINNSVPGGLFPPQLAIGPDFTMNRGYPLVFEDPEYMDLENFGNGIFPSPLASLGTALNARRGDLTPVLTGDKLDLYLSVPILHANKVMFQLTGPSGMTPMTAQRVTRPFPHTFQLEEEQAIIFLPSWPGIESGMESVFSSVTLMYKSKDAAPIGTALGANLRLGAVLQKALSDLDMELTALLQNALPAAVQAQVIAFQGTLRAVKNELPSGPELDVIRNDLNELKKLQDRLEALRGGMLVPGLFKSLGEARELLVMVQATVPPAAQRKIAELQGTITGLEGSLSNFLNPSVAPQLETDYMEMPMMMRQIGDQVIWETMIDDIQPGKAYHYYYKVVLANPVTITLPGQAPIMISQWAMPDPRNLQVEDRGIIERLITPEIQAMIGHILNPAINAIAADQPFVIAPPTLENIRPGFELALAILPEASKLIEDIGVNLDPMLDSVFTVPVLDGSQSLWIGKYDFGMLPDGEYTLSASVYDASGNPIPDTQLPGKRFMVDRTAPMANVMIEHDPNVVGIYQREDGSHVATVLPTGEGSATLTIKAMPAGPQNGLVGYLYQMMPVNGNLWGPLVVTNGDVNPGLARDMLSDLLTGVPLVAGIQVPDMIQDAILDDLSTGFDLLDEIPITLSAPHQLDLLLRAPTPPELAALAGTTGLLPINIGRDMTTLQLNNYRIRAVGIDNLINISSHTVPVMLDVVSPDADMAMISYIVIGDCNGDGDTDDVGESGPADGSSVYSNLHDVMLTVKIAERTMHPLTSIRVEYSMDAGATWTMIETHDMAALTGKMKGDTFDVAWNIDNYEELVAAGVEKLMVRAVTTNALTISDSEAVSATITVDPDVCPVPPTVLGVEVTLHETNPDSDPDINNLDSEGNHADGPLVGGAMGNITVAAYTPYRTGPVTDKVRFEVRRKDGTEWMAVGDMAMESMVVKSEELTASGTASIVQGLVGMAADGVPTVPIPDKYQKWMIEIDTAMLDDTITKDDAAEGRDVRMDENPYIIRAVAIAGGADHTNDRVHASFSVDNVDDVAPLESTMIVMVSDNAGMLMASEVGVFTVGGIVDDTVPAPVAILTAKPRAHVSTFDHIKLMVNMRNADGTLGAMVDVGKVVFESSGGYYTATLDVSDLANAEYGFQALAVDKAMNVEKKVDDVATDIDVENYTPPPDSVTISEADDITEAHRGGYLVTKSFTFTVVAAGIHPPEIDVMLGGSSARGAGLLTVEKTDDGGGGLADPRTFVVTLDTSTTPDGKYELDGVVIKRNGSSIFELPMINIDNTGPMVEIGTPVPGHEMSSLPTIRATFTDGMGGGVESSSDTVMLELVRLMPAGESVDIPVSQDDVEKPDAYIVEDDPETVMVEADMGDIVYTSVDVLPGGAYQVTIKVTDVLGNTTNMGMGVMADFTIAGTLPGVSIQSPTSGQGLDYDMPEIIVVYSGVGTMIKSFTLSNEAGEMVAVNDPVMVSAPDQLDDNKMSYMPTEALDDGKYTAVVMVEDANGEVARDAVTFMVSADDTTKPVITQVSPQGVIKSDSATLSVQAFDEQSGVAKVMISIDGGDSVEGDTQEVTGLESGGHTVDAVVTNGAGLETPFTWTFTVVLDETGPEISSGMPQGVVGSDTVMVSAVVADEQSGLMKVMIAVDGGDAMTVLESDPENVVNRQQVSHELTGLASGMHKVVVVAESEGGSTTHSWTFTVDDTPPEIAAVAPEGVVKAADVMLSAVVVDEQSPVTKVTITLDGTATDIAEADIKGGKVSLEAKGLTPGSHSAMVVAESIGGSTTHSWTFTVVLDTTPPEISSVAPQGVVKEADVMISAVVVDDQSPIESVTIAVDGGVANRVAAADVQAGKVSQALTGLTSGTHTVEIVAMSKGGSTVHSWTFTVELDTTPPEISSVAPQGLIRKDAVSISAVVVDEQSPLESVTIALDDGAPRAVATVDIQNGRVGRDVIALTTGTHTVTIIATSAGGTTAHAWTFTVELDEKPPTITSTGPHGLVRKERPVVSVIATDDLSGVDKIEITLVDSSGKKVSGKMEQSSQGTSATFIPTSAFTDDTQGTYVAKVKVTDVRGNEASVQWSFTVEFDTVPPVITTATPQGEARITERKPLISAAYTDAASGIDIKSVKMWVDGKPVQPTKVSPSQVTYMPLTDLNYGRYTVKLEVSDLATRKQNKTTHEWSFYVEAKTTRIVDARPIPNPFTSSTTITFTLSRQARVTIEIYDMSSRLVRTLRRGRMYEVGDASKVMWDGKTDTGEDLARGVYFCRIVLDSELMPQFKVLKLALTR